MSYSLFRISFKIDTSELLDGEIKINALGNALDKLARKSKRVDDFTFRKNATKKLKNMVIALAKNVATNAYENTPVGDESRLEYDNNYLKLYRQRATKFGIDIAVGYHRGAYSYSDSKIPEFHGQILSYDEMISNIVYDVKSNYKIGDTFYIGAKGPAYGFFEKGFIASAPDGVAKPTIESIMQTYAFDLQAAYSKKA